MAAAGLAALTLAPMACSTDVPPPTNLVDPSTSNTPEAALGMYRNALYKMAQAWGGNTVQNGSYITFAGVFSDEFTGGGSNLLQYVDSHTATDLTNVGNTPFAGLSAARTQAAEAIRALRANGEGLPDSYIAELHAIEGYVYVLMSELYCSGVPFTSLDDDGRIQYGRPETTQQMLDHAVAQFDSALALAADSVRIQSFAAVGKGRALLDKGDPDGAAAAVAQVATNFAYDMRYSLPPDAYGNFLNDAAVSNGLLFSGFTMSDNEGSNGLFYLTDGDARVAVTSVGFSLPQRQVPTRYLNSPTIPLADGIEARLIEAEAQLAAGDPLWLTTLNALRNNGFTTAPNPTIPGAVDTTWIAGPAAAFFTPALPGLPSLTDPGSDTARVALLFRERAYWLYATGHRQGDMRRLVRQYGRPANLVYPIGAITYPTVPIPYVPDATLPLPITETSYNPYSNGCLNRDA
jgi:hypothetical protein